MGTIGDVNDPLELEAAIKRTKNGGMPRKEVNEKTEPKSTPSMNIPEVQMNQEIIYNLQAIRRGVTFFVVLASAGLATGVIIAFMLLK